MCEGDVQLDPLRRADAAICDPAFELFYSERRGERKVYGHTRTGCLEQTYRASRFVQIDCKRLLAEDHEATPVSLEQLRDVEAWGRGDVDDIGDIEQVAESCDGPGAG